MIFGTTVRNKRHGAEDGSGQDWMGGYTRWPEAYLVTLADRCESFNDWGGRGYDDSVPGVVNETAPSGYRTA